MEIRIPRKDESERKTVNTRIRMTPEDSRILDECAKHMKSTKSDVLMTGLYMVYDDIQNEKKDNGEV